MRISKKKSRIIIICLTIEIKLGIVCIIMLCKKKKKYHNHEKKNYELKKILTDATDARKKKI